LGTKPDTVRWCTWPQASVEAAVMERFEHEPLALKRALALYSGTSVRQSMKTAFEDTW
jgi:Flp pilus assembly protein CpaB